MFCAKCGTELNEGAEFCSKCGAKAGASTEGQNTTNQQNENRPVATQVVVMPTGTGPLVMGLLGLFGGFIPIVKYITGLLSLLAIFVGASQRKKLIGAGLPAGKATAGIVLGTIAVLITVITIAFSAMVIGSLFSNNRTSRGNNKSFGLFANRTLPLGIQNTIWTNGNINVEFGKNKVKLNDEWYSVKRIAKGDSGTNWMFTRVDFGDNDNYAILSSLDNGLRLSSLNNHSDFMTPAEMEEKRKIIGEWEGSYTANQGTGMRLVVTENFIAKFDYFSLPGRSNIESGSYRMSVSYINGVYQFKFMNWIVQPTGHFSIDFKGRLRDNVLTGTMNANNFFSTEMGTFIVRKKN